MWQPSGFPPQGALVSSRRSLCYYYRLLQRYLSNEFSVSVFFRISPTSACGNRITLSQAPQVYGR
nr:MAG TPA: hypothetical protein [Caudoviricetes sp.]